MLRVNCVLIGVVWGPLVEVEAIVGVPRVFSYGAHTFVWVVRGIFA